MMTDTHTHINQQGENNTHCFNPTVTSFNTEERNAIENLRPFWNGITLAAMAVSCLPLNISFVYTPGKNIQYGALRKHYKIKSSILNRGQTIPIFKLLSKLSSERTKRLPGWKQYQPFCCKHNRIPANKWTNFIIQSPCPAFPNQFEISNFQLIS